MLAYVTGRLAWAIPTLFGVVLGVYFLSTLLPPAEGAPKDATATEVRSLPRFFNPRPEDVARRTRRALNGITGGSEKSADLLASLGSAALPELMRRWPSLDGPTRDRAAHAMLRGLQQLHHRDDDPVGDAALHANDAATLELYWGDREMDYAPISRERALDRMLRHPSVDREEDYIGLGTFGLEPLFERLRLSDRRDQWMTLTRVASKITGREDAIKDTDDAQATSAKLGRWRQWWLVYEGTFATRTALGRPLASFTETGFGKRIGGIYLALVTARATGDDAALARLADSAATTFGLVVTSTAIAYALAVAYAALSHARRLQPGVRAANVALTVLCTVPAFVLARVVVNFIPGRPGALLGPLFVMVAASLPSIARQERATLGEAIRSDYLRTARAKGASEVRVLIAHALRATLGPSLVWASAEIPGLLGISLIVEELWDVHGLGWQTLRAVEARSETWLMASALLMGVVAVLLAVAADVAHAVVDPRVRYRVVGTDPR